MNKTIDLSINREGLAHNIQKAKENNIIIPTIAQMQNPDLIPEKIKPCRGEIPDRHQHDHVILERGVEPFENPERLFQVKHALTSAVTGNDDEIAESLNRQGLDDFTDKV